MKNKTILVIGTEMWGKLFVSKHYVAKYLAENGNRVYYLNPVCLSWRPRSLVRAPVLVEDTHIPGLSVVSYGNPVPRLAAFPAWLQRLVFRYLIYRLRSALGQEIDLVWSFDLTRFPDLLAWRPSETLLHLVELFDHPHFEHLQPHREGILLSADHVVSIADLISEQISPLRPDAIQLFHGADVAGFRASPTLEELGKSLPGQNRLKAGFVGNFQFSFDFGLLEELSKANPDVDFLLIGPNASSSNLGNLCRQVVESMKRVESLSNVFFLGLVPSEQVVAYLSELDINLILYGQSFWQGHCNPHKLMAYFYAGKPIVASFIHEYRNRPELITTVKDRSSFLAAFLKAKEDVLREGAETGRGVRREFALEHSYEELISRIGERLFGTRLAR